MNGNNLHLELESADKRRTLLYQGDCSAVLSDILRHVGVPLNTRCGQRGLCQGCELELLAGGLTHVQTLKPLRVDGGPVLIQACQYRAADSELVLRVPPRSLLAYEPQVVSEFRLNVPLACNPLWQQYSLPPGRYRDAQALLYAVRTVISHDKPLTLEPVVREQLAADSPRWVTLERMEEGWQVTHLAENPAPRPLGLAVDLGTTTVAVMLVDMADGAILGRAVDFNRQMHFGDDVLTRINLCGTDPTMLHRLGQAVVSETLQPLIESLLRQAPARARLVAMAVAGNTIMLHLLAGVDPSSMGVAPFTASFLGHRVMSAPAIGMEFTAIDQGAGDRGHALAMEPSPAIHLLPGAAAYIGADLTAGILASGLLYDQGPSLLVDVGTNGEIILKHGKKLLGCATAAGPAFEGVRLSSGMRAGAGAISHLVFDGPPEFAIRYEVIGGGKPVGLCGSAYIDVLGQGRRMGLLGGTGRFEIARVADRLEETNGHGRALHIAYASGRRPLMVTETDIATLLQAKAAIAAGILTLLHRLHLEPVDIRTLYLAGGFGMHVDVPNAIAAGLLPGFSPEQVQVVGNTSLGGAYLALLDAVALDEIKLAALNVEVVELNLSPDFESCYIDQLALP